MSLARNPFNAYALCAVLLVIPGCIDVDPVKVQADTADGGSSPGPCELCLEAKSAEQRACDEPLAACAADAKCAPFLACSLASGCFEATSQEDASKCVYPCALRAGVASSVDPAVTLLLDVGACSAMACPQQCFPDATQ